MSLPKTYSTGGRSRGLPVDGTIDYRSNGPVEPMGEWPPLAIKTRMDRLSWLWELFHGDFSDLRENVRTQQNQTTPQFTDRSTSQFSVQANPFRMIPTAIADILMMEPPEYPDPRQSVNINSALYDIIVHQFAYGAAVVLATGDPMDPLMVLEPAWWVPTDEGWWYVEPIADENGNYLSVNIMSSTAEGISHCTYSFGGTYWSNIGDPIGYEVLYPTDEDPLRVIPRAPRHTGGTWGTSVLEDMASIVASINQRYSDIDTFLRKQATPNLLIRIADADRDEIDEDIPPAATFDEAIASTGKALDGYDDQTKWALSDAIQGTEALTWDARVGESIAFVEHLQGVLEATASIPGLFHGLADAGIASGVALKRLLMRLYAASLHIQKTTEVAVNELLALSGVAPLDWPNALDAMEDATDGIPQPEEGMIE